MLINEASVTYFYVSLILRFSILCRLSFNFIINILTFVLFTPHSSHLRMHSAVGCGSFPARECTYSFTHLRAKVVAFACTRPAALQGVPCDG